MTNLGWLWIGSSQGQERAALTSTSPRAQASRRLWAHLRRKKQMKSHLCFLECRRELPITAWTQTLPRQAAILRKLESSLVLEHQTLQITHKFNNSWPRRAWAAVRRCKTSTTSSRRLKSSARVQTCNLTILKLYRTQRVGHSHQRIWFLKYWQTLETKWVLPLQSIQRKSQLHHLDIGRRFQVSLHWLKTCLIKSKTIRYPSSQPKKSPTSWVSTDLIWKSWTRCSRRLCN